MIKIDLKDSMLEENIKALEHLRSLGIYTDEQLQKMYDEQVAKDKKETAGEG